jgi:hypothetical protein
MDSRANYFTYSKSNIAVGSNFEIEARIAEQYEKIVNPQLVPADQPAKVKSQKLLSFLTNRNKKNK